MIEPNTMSDWKATDVSSNENGNGSELPVIACDLPVMFEDEGQENMGESEPHSLVSQILTCGITNYLARLGKGHRVFSDLNVYYHQLERWAYVSPDVMVTVPGLTLPERLRSYRIGKQGPAPIFVTEILSRRSAQQQDLTNKPILYAMLGIAEYLLIDSTAEFLPERIRLLTLQDDGTWLTNRDADEGMTSRLGFRVVFEEDDLPRVIGVSDGRRYLRPSEIEGIADAKRRAEQLAESEGEARRLAEERIRILEEELARSKLNGRQNS